MLKLCYSPVNSLHSGHQPQTLRIMKPESLMFLTPTLILSVLCTQSCIKRDSLWVSNYICSYYEANSTSDWICDTSLDANRNLESISIKPFMDPYFSDRNSGFSQITEIIWLLEPESRKAIIFDSLSRAWNDHNYNIWKMERWSPAGPIIYSVPGAVITELTDIAITCDNAWDDSHPAGSSLNDIFDITYCSFYPFINNNYNKKYLEEDSEYEARAITKPLSELRDYDLKLLSISRLFSLTPKSLPQTPGLYDMKICAYDSDGTEYLRGSCYFVIRQKN